MNIASYLQFFPSFIPGKRLIDGSDLLTLVNLEMKPVKGLTALAGGGQTGATLLTGAINEVATVASGNDSVMLPLAIPGVTVWVINDSSANSMQVFGQPSNPANGGAGDTIAPANSVTQAATGTGVGHAATNLGVYVCFALGKWKQGLCI